MSLTLWYVSAVLPKPVVEMAALRLGACSIALAISSGACVSMHRVPSQPVPREIVADKIESTSTVANLAASEEPAAPETPPVDTAVIHVVEPGQTLWRIAHSYGVPLAVLARANEIDDATRIDVGQTLRVPGALEPLTIAAYPAPLDAPPQVAAPGATFAWPVAGGTILSHFGVVRRSGRHAGIDIRGERGQPVLAAQAGRVTFSGSSMRGYGKTVMLDHGDGWVSLYAHNSALHVAVGDFVQRGQAIADVGRTGNATTDHCHFEIRQGDRPVDPLQLLEPMHGALR
jgi:LysM repeat protein